MTTPSTPNGQSLFQQAVIHSLETRSTKPGSYNGIFGFVNRYFSKPLSIFPLPFQAKNRAQSLSMAPAKFFGKQLLIGSIAGAVFALAWGAHQKFVTVPHREDYYVQLAKANANEMEKLRLRLVEEAKERKANE